MKKVLFVCLGNICRSPLAEALFRKHIKDHNLINEFSCDSCGTAAYHIGAAPDTRSVANALKNGLEYTHSGRQLSSQDFNNFDYIIAMDDNNFDDIKALNSVYKNIFKLRDFDSTKIESDVPDPYFGRVKGFQDVFEIIDRSTLHLLKGLYKS